MVADFMSADYGWLRSPDGKESARVYFSAGKGKDGYFENKDILAQAHRAMDILAKHYPDEDHILIYDNTTTHRKRAEDALSATKMPKGPSPNFFLEVNVLDEKGNHLYDQHGKYLKKKIKMGNAKFNDGKEQELYFPDNLSPNHPDYEHRGKFKGIARLLKERGLPHTMKLQCDPNTLKKCPPGQEYCCCRRALYSQPDFVNYPSLLETEAKKRGFLVVFLPKFHCELNPIEQCWGYAKRVYRLCPPSSKPEDLAKNVHDSLKAVPMESMRSLRFMDAYRKGLNGNQAAWAARKYCGHCVIPDNILQELDKHNIH
ncbi:hypothetical protein MPER_03592 [Moniliophthora perniciosa FA553]|nr:hypothetical protein MPER_03592 [Moniliophthora perniciosa FA553]